MGDQAITAAASKSAAEAEIVEDAGDGFGVAERAGANPSLEFVRREGLDGDALVVFGLRGAGAKAARDVDDHAFADEAGRGINVEDFLPAARGVAGFFEELALRAGEWRFAGLHAASDEFPEIVADGMAILANENHVAVVEHGKDDDGAVVHDDVALGADAAGLDDGVVADIEDGAVEDHLAGKNLCASRHGEMISVFWRSEVGSWNEKTKTKASISPFA